MTTTEEQPDTPPPERTWTLISPDPEPATTTHSRSESPDSADDPGHPVGHWIVGGLSALGVGGVGLFDYAGWLGVAVGGAAVAAPAAMYGAYKLRGDGRRSPYRTTRAQRTTMRRTTTRSGMTGLGGGKGPRLGGRGRGGHGGGHGPGGGRRRGFGADRRGSTGTGGTGGGRMFGGGRGSRLGGKLGTGRGTGTGRGPGRAAGTGGRGRARAASGRSGLGARTRAAGKNAVAAAGRTKTGQRVTKATQAARGAAPDGGRGRFARWNTARQAARRSFGTPRTRAGRWSAEVGAGFLALFAMFHAWWRKHHPKVEDAGIPAKSGEKTPGGEKASNNERPSPELDPIPMPDSTPGSGQPNTTRRNSTMSATSPIEDAALQVEAVAARHWPRDMWQVDQELEQIHTWPEHLANAVHMYTQTLQSAYPVERVVVEALGRLYMALGQVSAAAQEISPLFKKVHEDDIKKRTQPRIGEEKWNV